VSKIHCEITRRERAYWIKDVGSTNGTYLNGNRINPNVERELRFGDVVGLGVSHVEDNDVIDVTKEQYYVFVFRQADPVDDFDGSSGFSEISNFTDQEDA